MFKDQLQRYRSYRNLLKYYDRKLAEGITRESGVDLRESRALCAEKVAAIEAAIEGLGDPTERLLLRLRYIEGKSWTQIGFIIHYSQSSTKRIHRRALEHIRGAGS